MSNMTAAVTVVDRLSRLLRDEIAAITAGKLGVVNELFPEKQELLSQVEEVFAAPRPLLEDHPRSAELRHKLEEMRELIAQDFALLEKMTEATGAVIEELDRIRDRHSLSGIYGPDGAKRPKTVASSQHFDTSL
ncbi:hypothetical protein ACRARG_17615 [Pseudooceanicola sp. C21-150M6]|uniref:hypothetical protein n=1 Tax=Pseudooceanicola sp. C21-150M6 TaxID=3434355 RepID=UPI003D7F71BE